jgi:UDP-glucose 4-epimerase
VARIFAGLAGYQPEILPLEDKPVGVQARYADTSLLQSRLHWAPKIPLETGFARVLKAAERRVRQPLVA